MTITETSRIGQSQVDLVLVNPGGRKGVYQSLGTTLTAIEPPIWAGLIANFVRQHGFTVQIVDAEADDLSVQETIERVSQLNPTLTAVVVYGHQPSASTQNMSAAGAVCAALKQQYPELKTALVGGHVAALPERTLVEEDVDFVSGGEGVHTLLALIKALTDHGSYDKVPALWYRDGDVVRTTPPAPLMKHLDTELPGVAWDLLPMEKYRAHNWHCFGSLSREPYAALYTTLGCPYHCSFCCIQAPFKSGERQVGYKQQVNSYRFWSPQFIIDQLDTLVTDYGVRNIKIADEMFVLNSRHVTGICDLIVERGYDLNIWAYARVDTVKEGMIDKLKEAGFSWLALGIESASEHVRDGVQKGFDQDRIYETIDAVRSAGIHVIANFIFGLPDDTLETMQATLDLATELNCEFANFYCAMAYPGSPLYTEAINAGWPLPETWNGYSQHAAGTLPLPTKHVSGAEVLRFRDYAFNKYFNSPRYLDMITNTFGSNTTDQIREMCSHKLVRQHT